jgi:hypothetical protein
MNLKFIPFIKETDTIITDITEKSKIISAALGLALSNLSHFPTSEVDNPTTYFNFNVLPTSKYILSEWNEDVIFDVKECVEQMRMFWLIRYTAAYPLSRPIYSFKLDFFETLIGVNTFTSECNHEFLDKYKNQILALSVIATNIIITMKNQ